MKSVGPKKNVILPLLCGKNVFPGQILQEIWGWAGKYQGNGKANRLVNRKSRSFPAGERTMRGNAGIGRMFRYRYSEMRKRNGMTEGPGARFSVAPDCRPDRWRSFPVMMPVLSGIRCRIISGTGIGEVVKGVCESFGGYFTAV
nr:MAG TPA: hypothetical protein [Caudoviricetes sp.]